MAAILLQKLQLSNVAVATLEMVATLQFFSAKNCRIAETGLWAGVFLKKWFYHFFKNTPGRRPISAGCTRFAEKKGM